MENKIKGVGIDTSTFYYKPDPAYLPDTLYINTSSNNSFYLPDNYWEGRNLIVEVGSGEYVREILRGLGLERIDTLLFPAESLKVRENELGDVLDEYGVQSVGISRPGSLTQLKDAAGELKKVIIPSYLSLPICPVHFQKEILDWADINQLGIIGLNPFGGYYLAPSVISSFSIPFLLSFSAAYSDVVILSGRSLVDAQYETLYLEELIGEDRLGETEMKNTILHSPKTLPKFIYTGLKGGPEYENPWYLIPQNDLTLKMEPIEMIEGEEGEGDDEVRRILEEVAKFDILTLPHPDDPETYMSILRPTILKELGEALGPSYHIEQEKIGSLTFLVNIRKERREKRYLGKDKVWYEDRVFVMWLTRDGELKFKYYGEQA
jgi:hypothetical protein